MKDPLEDFIRQNRNAFDDKEPSEKVWKNINAALPVKTESMWNSLSLWRAAAIVFMALSIYLLIPGKSDRNGKNLLTSQATDFNDVEAFYFQQISEKV
ncbi:MAG: hypothetical protein C0490_28550, partial [Marivirga sp.]|nr:hypothetical protein [Marivirga sp.]